VQRVEDGLDRIVTAPAGSKPIRADLEPGFPLGFQRVLHPGLQHSVENRGNAERTEFVPCTGLGDVRPLDRQGLPGPGLLWHPCHQLRPSLVGERHLTVDPSRRTASIELRDPLHADQRVAMATEHQLLQTADPLVVPGLRSLEDPLS
jgi:hypothetical protein